MPRIAVDKASGRSRYWSEYEVFAFETLYHLVGDDPRAISQLLELHFNVQRVPRQVRSFKWKWLKRTGRMPAPWVQRRHVAVEIPEALLCCRGESAQLDHSLVGVESFQALFECLPISEAVQDTIETRSPAGPDLFCYEQLDD